MVSGREKKDLTPNNGIECGTPRAQNVENWIATFIRLGGGGHRGCCARKPDDWTIDEKRCGQGF